MRETCTHTGPASRGQVRPGQGVTPRAASQSYSYKCCQQSQQSCPPLALLLVAASLTDAHQAVHHIRRDLHTLTSCTCSKLGLMYSTHKGP